MKDSVNYLAIAVSAIASILLSYVWYMLLFKAPYIASIGKTQEQMAKGPNFPTALVIQLVGNLVMTFVLAWLIKMLGYTTIGDCLKLSVLIWLGFVAAVIGPMYAFEASSFRLLLINSGSVLVSLLITGTILSVWK